MDRLEDVDKRQRALVAEYAKPEDRRKTNRVADLHQGIGLNLKLAAIHAHLAIAQALHDIEARP